MIRGYGANTAVSSLASQLGSRFRLRSGFVSQDHRSTALAVARRIKHERGMLLTPLEAAQIFFLVKATSKLGGAIAEVGVYRGGSARLIHEADANRELHLFDTFEGLPETSASDTAQHFGQFQEGQFACSIEDVQRYLGGSDHLHFYKGLFPDTGNAVRDEQFSFVHSDVDIYESTRAVLEFFYPRMLPGAIFLSHDFASGAGPHRAITEFFEDLQEPVIELPGDQAMVVKLQ